jgi:aryl-alcohol dehydrogenase-like predicted oxidoreductase
MISREPLISVGLGLYAPSTNPQCLVASATSLVTYLDTAPHYAAGRAEQIVGNVLAETETAASRPQVGIKLGVRPPNGHASWDCAAHYNARKSILQSRTLVQTDQPVAFVHNPEWLFRNLPRPDAVGVLRTLMALLQELADDQKIAGFGIATYDGLWDHISVDGLHEIATHVAAGRQTAFRLLQVPASIVHNADIARAIVCGTGVLHDARRLGWHVFASQPFFHGKVREAVAPPLLAYLSEDSNPFRLSFDFVCCSGLFDTIIVGCSTREHLEQVLIWRREPALRPDRYSEFLTRCL